MIRIEEKQTIVLPGITSLFVTFDFNRAVVDVIKSLENVNYNENTYTWEIPLTGLGEFLDRATMIDDIELKLMEDTHTVADNVDVMSFPYKTIPLEHQYDGIRYGLTHDSWLLLDAPGLGKTLQIIYTAMHRKLRGEIDHCLIICGINTLKTNWKSEIEKHSDLSCRILGERITRTGKLVVEGIPERLKQLQSPIEEFFVITNVETLRDDNIVKSILKNKYNKFDMVVVDEIHRCKSNQSAQGKNLLKLNKAKYKIGATGTLMLNNPLDTYVPLKWTGNERANFTNFRYYYCCYGGPFGNEITGYKNTAVLQSQIKSCSLRRTKDRLNLPPKNIIVEYVDMNDAQSKFYENLKAGIVHEANLVKLRPANILSMVLRLRQATACPEVLTTNDIISSKVERAVDLAEQIITQGDKVVIFSTFKATVEKLVNKLASQNYVVVTGDEDDFEIEQRKQRFQNDPQTSLFIGTWQKAGTGITLNAATYMIFIDTPWTFGDFDQACDRIHRIGTTSPVFIYNLVTKDSIDERVLELIQDKEALADYIVDEHITPQGLANLQKYIEDLS